MSSILTNMSATSAIASLTATQRALATTQDQISTGLKVASAQDNASYWSIATSMRSRISTLQTINDGLNITKSIVGVSTGAMTQIQADMQAIKQDLVTAQTAGASLSALQDDISERQNNIVATGESANFNGVNWLVTKVVGTDTTTISQGYDVSQSQYYGISDGRQSGIATETDQGSTVDSITESLGSTSESTLTSTAAGETFTTTSVARTLPATGYTVSTFSTPDNNTSTSTGDLDGYRNVNITMGDNATDTVNLTPIELFKSLSGNQYFDDTQSYTDVSNTEGSVASIAGGLYIDAGQSDVLELSTHNDPGLSPLRFSLTNFESTGADATMADIESLAANVDSAIDGLTAGQAFLGGLENRVDGQQSYNTQLIDSLTSGVGSLVDADMDQSSTRLAALQTQRQLGMQSLAIANDNIKQILKLFGS